VALPQFGTAPESQASLRSPTRARRTEADLGLSGIQRGSLNLQPDQVKNGIAQLVLTLVKLLHELLEKQAIRRVQAGDLDPMEVERLGTTLMKQADEIDRLRRAFNLDEADLNLDLGPLGRLL
jgi:hypothetical protein